ncbi:MAG TPA: CYTH and CHAD domain-containing protein, partial [Azospirillum sp.]
MPPPAPPASGAHEVELKLHVGVRDLPRVLALPALAERAEGAAVTRAVRTVYYDTPDLRLYARGVALRIRHEDGARVQGVKTMTADAAGDSAAIAVRQEWESPLPGDGPDFALLDAGGAGPLIPAEARNALGVLFETDLRRTTQIVRLDPLTTVEVAVDEGRVLAGTAAEGIAEVELELKSGRASRLFELALALQGALPVRIGTESKAAVGYRLVTGATPVPALPEPLALSPVTTVAEAFRHIVRHALRHLLANEACALAGGDAEGLHQIRVALRRLRTALRLFGPVVDTPRTAAIG